MIWNNFTKICQKIKILIKITEQLQTLRMKHTSISVTRSNIIHWIFIRVKMCPYKHCTEKQNPHFLFNIIIPQFLCLWDNWMKCMNEPEFLMSFYYILCHKRTVRHKVIWMRCMSVHGLPSCTQHYLTPCDQHK